MGGTVIQRSNTSVFSGLKVLMEDKCGQTSHMTDDASSGLKRRGTVQWDKRWNHFPFRYLFFHNLASVKQQALMCKQLHLSHPAAKQHVEKQPQRLFNVPAAVKSSLRHRLCGRVPTLFKSKRLRIILLLCWSPRQSFLWRDPSPSCRRPEEPEKSRTSPPPRAGSVREQKEDGWVDGRVPALAAENWEQGSHHPDFCISFQLHVFAVL